MRLLAALFLFAHGVAHLVGFRAAFWTPISGLRTSLLGGLVGIGPFGYRALGVAWLLVALGYWLSAGMLLARSAGFLHCALLTTLVSASMCLLFWPEARIGLLLDVLLLAGLLASSQATEVHLARSFQRELRLAGVASTVTPASLVEERLLAPLPEPVRRYLSFMGVVGKPRDTLLSASFRGSFRRGDQWSSCDVLQHDSRSPVARVFVMQVSLQGLLPVTVRDIYARGRGHMSAHALDWLRVAYGDGDELDVGELVTYLNDAILMAPSLLLGPETTWAEVDAQTFDVTLTDGGRAVTARVWLDERGAPRDFSTRDRFFDGPDGTRTRTEWRTPVDGWQDAHGRRLPTRARAVWQLPTGPFPYADFCFDPDRVSFNVPTA
jgi:hypothetical protein